MMRQLSPQSEIKDDAAAAGFVNLALLSAASIKYSYLRPGKTSDNIKGAAGRDQRKRRTTARVYCEAV